MKFKSVISNATRLGENRQIWLTTETFNKLPSKKIRLNRKDNIVISSDDIEIEISINEKLGSKPVKSFARIERISEIYANTKLIKADVYVSPKTDSELKFISIIL